MPHRVSLAALRDRSASSHSGPIFPARLRRPPSAGVGYIRRCPGSSCSDSSCSRRTRSTGRSRGDSPARQSRNDRAPVETVRIVVSADAILAAHLGPPAADVGQRHGCEQRMPRRRVAGEITSLLEIPAIVELELIAEAYEGGRQRESRIRRKTLLPSVQILEARAAGDVLELISPAQLAAGIQAAARLHIDHRGLLEAVAAEVYRVEIAADADPQAIQIGLAAQADAQSRQVELVQIAVLPHDQAAVDVPPVRGISDQKMARRGERLDE